MPPTGSTSSTPGGQREEDFEWVRRLLESQQDTDAEDYVHSLKIDMFDDEVFVFTPRGASCLCPPGPPPLILPTPSIPEVGNAMVGAKVNNRIANIDTPLQNGDIVEVLTSQVRQGSPAGTGCCCAKQSGPDQDQAVVQEGAREENILTGKASFESEMKRLQLPPLRPQ